MDDLLRQQIYEIVADLRAVRNGRPLVAHRLMNCVDLYDARVRAEKNRISDDLLARAALARHVVTA
jgi:hypothetical protein